LAARLRGRPISSTVYMSTSTLDFVCVIFLWYRAVSEILMARDMWD
jgi:hypothetical protein